MHAMTLRTPQERTRYGFALAVSILAWIGLVFSIVGALYAVLIAVAIVIGHALFLAHIRGNGVKLGPDQLPALWHRVDSAAKKLGLKTTPDAYVIQAGGLLNAFATKLFARKFVIIYSDLIDACEITTPSLDEADSPPTELDFVIAHEIGHIACGHLSWLLLPARIVPLLGPAYSRACEYTCDACGDFVTEDPEVSARALAILAGGAQLGRRLNQAVFADQRKSAGSFWMAIYELNASHPYLCKRVAALRERHQPGASPATGRNPVSYPLAPVFSIFTGGAAGMSMMMIIAMMGVMAAVAIPAYTNYLARAKSNEAALQDALMRSGMSDDALDLTGQLPSNNSGFISGETAPWTMRIPGPSWQPFPQEQAKQQNPLADGWMTRSDIDAHIMVIAEKAEETTTVAAALPVIIDNAKRAGSNYELIAQTPISTPGSEGVILHSKSHISDYDLEYLTVVRLTGGYLFQIVCFAETKVFDQVRPELTAAIESFEFSSQATPAGQPTL